MKVLFYLNQEHMNEEKEMKSIFFPETKTVSLKMWTKAHYISAEL